MKRVVYIELAMVCIVVAIVLWALQRVHIPGDTIIVREPDTTLHDLLYFELMHMVNLFGAICVMNLCYFIESITSEAPISTVRKFLYLSYTMTILVFNRCIFNIISYDKICTAEIVTDIVLIILLFTHKWIRPWFYSIFRHRHPRKI